MNIYLDLFSGITEEKLLGALLDLGLEVDKLKKELLKLNIIDELVIKRKYLTKKKIKASYVELDFNEKEKNFDLDKIISFIGKTSLPTDIKEKAENIFLTLAKAEAKVFFNDQNKVNFYNTTLENIIYVLSILISLKILEVEKIFASFIHSGNGYFKTSEGKVPIPLPLTQELLEDLPHYSKNINSKLNSPLSIALLSNIVDDFGPRNNMKIIKTGYGAAKKDLEIPNLLRVNLIENGEKTKEKLFNKYYQTSNKRDLSFKKIGIIRTPYKDNAPFQPPKNEKNDNFYIKLNKKYLKALNELEKFKYIYLLYYLNLSNDNPDLDVKPPWTNGKKVGLFASRSPNRFNPIGLSVVELDRIEGDKIYISSLDAFDKTPLLDIKPYIKGLDNKNDANYGWLDKDSLEHLELHIKGIPH